MYPGTKIETSNRNEFTAKILAEKGLTVAITTDAPVCNIMFLRYLTGLCIKYGMDYMDALKAITIYPAQICGIDEFYGDIRPNIESHMVIWDGDPLVDMTAKVINITDKETFI